MDHTTTIAHELGVSERQVSAAAALLDEGATVPFIARYRKEATGSLDEVAVTAVRDRLDQLRELDKRREAILKSIDDQGKLTDELRAQIDAADTMAELEDLYLPYKPRRRTRAMIAREKGLEPLAELLFAQDPATDPAAEAAAYVDAEKGVESAEDALAGARDIIAEQVNEDQPARARMRELFTAKAVVRSRVVPGKEEEGAKFRDYFEWDEPAAAAPSHRMLAMRRGENEGFLYLRLAPPEEDAVRLLEGMFVKGRSPASEQVRAWPSRTATSACSRSPWRPRCAWRPRSTRTRRPSASSPTTCASSCSPRRWAAASSWPSTPASAPAARSSASTARARCWPTTPSTRTPRPGSARTRPRRCRPSARAGASRRWPSATAPPGARRRRSSARSGCRATSPSWWWTRAARRSTRPARRRARSSPSWT